MRIVLPDAPEAVPVPTRLQFRRHAPKNAPCPHCGQRARRKRILHRTVRSLAYHAIVQVRLTTAEYRARCGCCKTFRTQVDGIEPKARYDNQVRDAVLDRLLDDRMSLAQIRQAMQRDFRLDLSEGFLYDCVTWKTRQYDGAAYRAWTLAHFSGTLCVDEVHLGPHTLLLATDPLADFPVAFALVGANDQEHMARFLGHLRDSGLSPKVVVTDGSSLYPTLLTQLWPQAQHQLCIFHVLQDINQQVLKAVRRLGRQAQRRARMGYRKRRRGKVSAPRRWRRRQCDRRRALAKQIVRQAYLIVKRQDRLSAREQQQLIALLDFAPALRTLRRFMDEVHRLFQPAQSEASAWRRQTALLSESAYQAVPELEKVLEMLEAAKFRQMIAFLHSPAGSRVRTNNHVERMNRVLRLYEKTRYKWRGPRNKVRFVCLLIDRRWGNKVRRWLAGGRASVVVPAHRPRQAASQHGPPSVAA
jgi:Transposase